MSHRIINRHINRRWLIQGMMVSGILPAMGLAGCRPDTVRLGHTLRGLTMGTSYTVHVPRMPSGLDKFMVQREVDGILDNIDRRMSTYRPDSELSRFNNFSGGDWFDVSADTAAVVAEAIAVSDLTHGAFDVTAGPLVELWGFGPATRRTAPPAAREISAVRAQTGIGGLGLRGRRPALRKAKRGLRLDLSGIAKGYAVDRIAKQFSAWGIADFMVEVGGEIRVHGRNFQGQPWSLGIERPQPGNHPLQRVIAFHEGSVATSGDYRSWYRLGSQQISHIIDPRDGRPVGHTLASVTVVDRSTIRSDALSTGLMVLGFDEGRDVILRAGIAALLIVRRNDRLEEWASPAFKQIMKG